MHSTSVYGLKRSVLRVREEKPLLPTTVDEFIFHQIEIERGINNIQITTKHPIAIFLLVYLLVCRLGVLSKYI